MLTLEPTKDVELITSFVQGRGIRMRCSGGYEPIDPSMSIQDPNNIYMLAKINDEPVGFVCLFAIGPRSYAIHLCLRTVGQRTKDFVEMAMFYAREMLNANTIFAIYPKAARAVTALCRYFNFQPNLQLEDALNQSTPVPYACETLKIA
jgi:hypothetical protein